MPDLITLPEMLADLRMGASLPRYAVEGVIPAGGVTLLYGPSSSGKTGLAIATALLLATGRTWAGRPVDGGPVLYVAAEDRHGVRIRICAVAKAMGVEDAPLAVAARPRESLAREGAREALIEMAHEAIERLGELRLIVIDTLATVFGDASQDDAGPASVFMNALEDVATEHNLAILVVHHTGKSGGAMRGSQVLFDRADAVLKVRAGTGGATVEIEKLRNGPGGAKFAFDIGARDLPIAPDAFDDEAEDAAPQFLSVQIVTNIRAMTAAAGVLDGQADGPQETDRALMMRVLREVTELVTPGNRASRATWRDACYAEWAIKTEGARKKAFSTGLKSLIDEGKVSVQGDTVTILVTGDTGNERGNHAREVTDTVTTPPLKRGVEGNGGNRAEPSVPVTASLSDDIPPPSLTWRRKHQ